MNTLINDRSRPAFGLGVVALAALLAACSGSTTPNAIVKSVAAARALEGDALTSSMVFAVTLDKAAVGPLEITYSVTAASGDTATPGSCGVAGADVQALTAQKLTIATGATSGSIAVPICGDALFEPNETFTLSWQTTPENKGVALGTIVNDDAGGLNGVGLSTVLGGGAAFGRDTDPLTNSATDGPLGFAFAKATCTTDKVTGLVWQRGASTATGFAGATAQAAQANAQGLCGYSDWRVPRVDELLSLMLASAKVTDSPFVPNADAWDGSDAMAGTYWSAESRGSASAVDAFVLDASAGGIVSFVGKGESRALRLVRGGTAAASACDNSDKRFVANADATVSDQRTGLVWKSCVEGTTGAGCATGTAAVYTTAAAIVAQAGAANTAQFAARSDWRVPNRAEMASLINRACVGNAAAPAALLPQAAKVNFASSTPDATNAANLWSIDFTDAGIAPTPLAAGLHLRLVRGGQ